MFFSKRKLVNLMFTWNISSKYSLVHHTHIFKTATKTNFQLYVYYIFGDVKMFWVQYVGLRHVCKFGVLFMLACVCSCDMLFIRI